MIANVVFYLLGSISGFAVGMLVMLAGDDDR